MSTDRDDDQRSETSDARAESEERLRDVRATVQKLSERFARLARAVGDLRESVEGWRREQDAAAAKVDEAIATMQRRLGQLREAKQVQASTHARVQAAHRALVSRRLMN